MTTQAPQMQQDLATCPMCGRTVHTILAHRLRRGEGRVHYCESCDYGFLAENKVSDAKTYYAEQYRQEYSHNAEATATHARELFDVYKNFQRDRLRDILPFLKPDSKVLEVGASSGQFLVHIQGKVAQIHATELDPACCGFLRNTLGIEVEDDFLENTRFANERYDVVCAFQVMEHVEDPVGFLDSLKQVTKPGGLIFIEVPNLRDPLLTVWNVPTYRTFFYHSAHLHYFTEASLRSVATKAGFVPDAVDVAFTQDYNLLNHLHWVMNDGPQADCMVGLSEVNVPGSDQEMSDWLTTEMKSLNERYMERLVKRKSTSNMMMRLRRD